MSEPTNRPFDADLEPLERAHRRHIARRLPLLGGLTLFGGLGWFVVLALVDPLPWWFTGLVLAGQLVVFTLASAACRADPTAPRVTAIALVACIVVGSGWAALFAATATSASILAFVLFTLYVTAPLVLAWGFGPQLAFQVAVSIVWLVATSLVAHPLPFADRMAVALFGFVIALATGEWATRAFREAVRRKETERALSASRDSYRDLAERARDIIWRTDALGRLSYVNDAGIRCSGFSASELIGRDLGVFLTDHPANAAARAIAPRLRAGEVPPPQLVQLRSASGPRWIELVVNPIRERDGTFVGIHGVGRDVTERRSTEDQLQESEHRFRSVFEHAPIGMILLGPDLRVVEVNHALVAMLGRTEAEMVGHDIGEFIHEEDRAESQRVATAVLAGEVTSVTAERRAPHKDGHVLWLQVRSCIERDAHGALRQVIVQVADVTEQRVAAEALRASLAELRESREQLRQLAQRQVDVREAERKRLGLDLHDGVCQELVGIGILAASLRQRLGPPSAETAAEFDRLQRYLGEVVEHIRGLARELRPLLLPDLGLEGSLRSLAAGLSSASTEVETVFTTPVPRLVEDLEVTVYRITQEAIGNAIRHARARHIALTLRVAGGRLVLEVCDDGTGFNVESRRPEALGLLGMEERALAIGGRLDVTSSSAGTMVRLECPAELADATPTARYA